MGGDPKDEGLGNLQGFLEAIIQSDPRLDPTQRYSGLRIDPSTAPTTGQLDERTNRLFDAGESNINRDVNRSIGQAGQLASGRGYAQGLSNPFAYAQHAENQARSGLGGLGNLEAQRAGQLMQNPLTAFGAGNQATQFNTDLLLKLIGMKGDLTSQRQGNAVSGIAGGLVSGAGQLGGAYLSRPPSPPTT